MDKNVTVPAPDRTEAPRRAPLLHVCTTVRNVVRVWRMDTRADTVGPMPAPVENPMHAYLSLRDPAAVRTLLHAGATPDHVRLLVSEFDTWAQLRDADAQRLLTCVGPAMRHWRLPSTPTTRLPLGAHGRVDLTAGRTLLSWTRGPLRLRPQLAITGSTHPSPAALAVAASAVFVAGRYGAVVTASPEGTLGQTVTRAAQMFSVPLTWVCDRDPEDSPWWREPARDLLRHGGAVRWAETTGGRIDPQATARLLVQNACAVLAVDVEPYDQGGFPALIEALRDGRGILMHADPGRGLAAALGLLVQRDLTHAHTLAGIGLRLPGRDAPEVRSPVFAHPPVPITWGEVPHRVSEALRVHAPSGASSAR